MNEITLYMVKGYRVSVVFLRDLGIPPVDNIGVVYVSTPLASLPAEAQTVLTTANAAQAAALDAGTAEAEAFAGLVNSNVPLSEILDRVKLKYADWVARRVSQYAIDTALWVHRGKQFDA